MSFDTPEEICKGKMGYDTMTSLLGNSVLWMLFSAFLVFLFKSKNMINKCYFTFVNSDLGTMDERGYLRIAGRLKVNVQVKLASF